MAALNSLTTLSRSYTGEYIEILVQNLNMKKYVPHTQKLISGFVQSPVS